MMKIGLLVNRYWPIILFLLARLVLFLSLSYEGLRGYGDFPYIYHLALMGWPFFDLWVEYPPIFPFFSRLLYILVSGSEHTFYYLLAFVLTLAQAASIVVFIRICQRFYDESEKWTRTCVYSSLLVGLAYGWWYFDSLAVLAMLIALLWVIEGRDNWAGLVVAVGILIKWFPVFVLGVSWYYRPPIRALQTTLIALSLVALVLGILFIASPDMVSASLRSQISKGSWETVWALIDGNLKTGLFGLGPTSERYDPSMSLILRRNPSRVSPWLTLVFFVGVGVYLFWKAKLNKSAESNNRSAAAFLGITWCIFLLWSPGYSPQWVLYLLPLILLALPLRTGVLMAIVLVLVSLMEWPVMLSRGYFEGLWLVIPLRVILTILLALEFWSVVREEGFHLKIPTKS